jgi:hypothetical protein
MFFVQCRSILSLSNMCDALRLLWPDLTLIDLYDSYLDELKGTGAVEYEIIVKTAKKRGAGTGKECLDVCSFDRSNRDIDGDVDANVYLGMFGDKAKVERQELKETLDRTTNKFESGSVDRFVVYAPDVGKVRITHCCKSTGDH